MVDPLLESFLDPESACFEGPSVSHAHFSSPSFVDPESASFLGPIVCPTHFSEASANRNQLVPFFYIGGRLVGRHHFSKAYSTRNHPISRKRNSYRFQWVSPKVLNKGVVCPADINLERNHARDWGKARTAFRKCVLDPLEEVWMERERLLEEGQGRRWEPLLQSLHDLDGFGPLNAGELAMNLRCSTGSTPFFSAFGREERYKGTALVDDRDAYCYFGETGATRGLAKLLGFTEAEMKATKYEEKQDWMRDIFTEVVARLPAQLLGEEMEPFELQDVEWLCCEFSKDGARDSYPTPGLRRAGKPGPKKSRRTCGAENTEPAQRSAQRTGTQSWPKGRWAPPALQKEVSELRALYDKKKSALHNAGRTGDAAKVEAAREALQEVAGRPTNCGTTSCSRRLPRSAGRPA